ncbi:hypothetical protein JCM14469_05520 [Desulfatiferula olefinivorans]
MEHVILEIERLYQEKVRLFDEVLSVVRDERETIIRADIGSLWTFTRRKQELADAIEAIRNNIMETAVSGGLLEEGQAGTYSFSRLIAAIPGSGKANLLHYRSALYTIKNTIVAMARENRRFLEESMKTVEDLVQIIIRNCERDERYGRDRYLRQGSAPRAALVRGEA